MASMGFGGGVVDLSKADVVGKAGLPNATACICTCTCTCTMPACLTSRIHPPTAGPTFTGFLAMLAWRGGYLSKQLSWTNMMLVPMYWFKSAVFGRDISRF